MSVHTKVRIEREGCVQQLPDDVVHLVSGPYYGQSTSQLFPHIEQLARIAGTGGIARFTLSSDAEAEIVERSLGLTEPTTDEEFQVWEAKYRHGMDTLGPWYPTTDGVAELDALLATLDAAPEPVRSMPQAVRDGMKDELLSLKLILAAPGMTSKRFRLTVN